MDIYVVQPDDTINSIALKFDISTERLISDNGLINPNTLVTGQALIILYPKRTYIVREDDTLASIAESHDITLLQLVRNNPFLYDRQYIQPGESLVIAFNSSREIEVHGYSFVFLNKDILTRSLAYLTYLSVFNYQTIENTIVANDNNDDEIIKMAKKYDTLPILMISAFSPNEELDVEYAYQLLLDYEQQEKLLGDLLQILKAKGYYGVNLVIANINSYNQNLYLKAITNISKVLKDAGYYFMISITSDFSKRRDYSAFTNIDFKSIGLLVDRIAFLQSIWVKRIQPPSPVSNISLIRPLIEYVTRQVKHISIGKPQVAFDWELPYTPGISDINTLSLNSAITLAYEQQATIQLDEESQTPFYTYSRASGGSVVDHIVWFIDARSIRALDDVIMDNNLSSTGLWYIAVYNQQLFSIINANYSIIKSITS